MENLNQFAVPAPTHQQPADISFQIGEAASNAHDQDLWANLSVLMAHDFPTTKRYFIGESGQVEKQEYQNARTYKSTPFKIKAISDFARLIKHLSGRSHMLIVRGLNPRGKRENTWRDQWAFPEPPEGTNWVMLDIDGVNPPDGVSVVSVEAIQWLIQEKLPQEFRNVSCVYQFSGSAGILKADGTLLKPGLRVHLFFMLDRRVPGYLLAGYLRRHCIDTGFYSIEANKGGVAQFKHGIDPSPIRTASQPHYVAHPMIEAGVQCLLTQQDRDGQIQDAKEFVTLPEIDYPLVIETGKLQKLLRDAWCKERGYQPKSKRLLASTGPVTMRYMASPSSSSEVRLGRPLDRVEVNGTICRLFFGDEGTPGSWYVKKYQPHFANRYGDGECIPLEEISASAYAYVRDELKWFSDIPSHDLALDAEGRVPEFSTFVTAKYSLVLAPTGSGKTTRVINWMREKAEQVVVVYVAQTIPLVNQMQGDLIEAGVECFHYQHFQYNHTPEKGIFVTTNESLPKVLGCLNRDRISQYRLVIDEVHMALDDFTKSQKKLNFFCEAISRAMSVIFMTGTFTEIQHLMLSGTLARLEGGVLSEEKFCTYEFSPVKQNPLKICHLDYFRSDVIELFESIRDKHLAGEAVPRVMVMLNSSKMEMYRLLAAGFGMDDLVDIVSRPECLQLEIEEARVGNKPILITSPLFSVGLNLARELEVLYCRFDHLEADASRVIQTINRANRGMTPCEVRIYANPDEKPFYFPPKPEVLEQIHDALEAETDVINNATDMPVLLDRMAYHVYRKIESNPNQAIGQLIDENAFQNYQVVECLASAPRDEDKTKAFRELKDAGDDIYDARILERHQHFNDDVSDCLFWWLHQLAEEKRYGYKLNPDERRTDREIETDVLAVLMQLCGLDTPAKARKVSKTRLQVLFGDREPWLSDNANAAHYRRWAKEAASKTADIIPVVDALNQMALGQLDGKGFARKLNRDMELQKGIRALAKDEREYLSMDREFVQLATLRERVRKSNTVANNSKAESLALEITKVFLESIGVSFRVDGQGRRRFVNFAVPLIPECWNFDEMKTKLKRRKALLDALPIESVRVQRKLDGDGYFASTIAVCRGCRLFEAACCALGHGIDWAEEGIEAPGVHRFEHCDDYRPVRQARAA